MRLWSFAIYALCAGLLGLVGGCSKTDETTHSSSENLSRNVGAVEECYEWRQSFSKGIAVIKRKPKALIGDIVFEHHGPDFVHFAISKSVYEDVYLVEKVSSSDEPEKTENIRFTNGKLFFKSTEFSAVSCSSISYEFAAIKDMASRWSN